MKTTYYLEDSNGEILNYFNKLRDAQDFLLKLGPGTSRPYIAFNDMRIVCLKGQYKYEGRHAYYLQYNGQKFVKISKKSTKVLKISADR